jgi:hypothetical protein
MHARVVVSEDALSLLCLSVHVCVYARVCVMCCMTRQWTRN